MNPSQSKKIGTKAAFWAVAGIVMLLVGFVGSSFATGIAFADNATSKDYFVSTWLVSDFVSLLWYGSILLMPVGCVVSFVAVVVMVMDNFKKVQ